MKKFENFKKWLRKRTYGELMLIILLIIINVNFLLYSLIWGNIFMTTSPFDGFYIFFTAIGFVIGNLIFIIVSAIFYSDEISDFFSKKVGDNF